MYGSLNPHVGLNFATLGVLVSVLVLAAVSERSWLCAGQPSVWAAHSGGALPTVAEWLCGAAAVVPVDEPPPQPARPAANPTTAVTSAALLSRPAGLLVGL